MSARDWLDGVRASEDATGGGATKQPSGDVLTSQPERLEPPSGDGLTSQAGHLEQPSGDGYDDNEGEDVDFLLASEAEAEGKNYEIGGVSLTGMERPQVLYLTQGIIDAEVKNHTKLCDCVMLKVWPVVFDSGVGGKWSWIACFARDFQTSREAFLQVLHMLIDMGVLTDERAENLPEPSCRRVDEHGASVNLNNQGDQWPSSSSGGLTPQLGLPFGFKFLTADQSQLPYIGPCGWQLRAIAAMGMERVPLQSHVPTPRSDSPPPPAMLMQPACGRNSLPLPPMPTRPAPRPDPLPPQSIPMRAAPRPDSPPPPPPPPPAPPQQLPLADGVVALSPPPGLPLPAALYLAQTFGDGQDFVMSDFLVVRNEQKQGSFWLALYPRKLTRPSIVLESPTFDAHISLLVTAKHLPRESFERKLTILEKRVHKCHSLHVKGNFHADLAGLNYAWLDILVNSEAHARLHDFCAVMQAGLSQAAWQKPAFLPLVIQVELE